MVVQHLSNSEIPPSVSRKMMSAGAFYTTSFLYRWISKNQEPNLLLKNYLFCYYVLLLLYNCCCCYFHVFWYLDKKKSGFSLIFFCEIGIFLSSIVCRSSILNMFFHFCIIQYLYWSRKRTSG